MIDEFRVPAVMVAISLQKMKSNFDCKNEI